MFQKYHMVGGKQGDGLYYSLYSAYIFHHMAYGHLPFRNATFFMQIP